jgi:hypothetical protein
MHNTILNRCNWIIEEELLNKYYDNNTCYVHKTICWNVITGSGLQEGPPYLPSVRLIEIIFSRKKKESNLLYFFHNYQKYCTGWNRYQYTRSWKHGPYIIKFLRLLDHNKSLGQ